ncbi:MAG: flagellin lysine-N-methylase [Paenibacillus lautus]|uniref:flagellin lysine-N-methylase n=1 Tax=Paenibacillus lautus TaxID=1401 RepID=UPI0010DED793|nr:flagellin lysine-N-methylase [Paenibacillus lautus]MCI1774332.1 flagellin lysine-N-methylase [Paenibacillus lautus]VTR39436.1 Flagellar biosynthetic protein fliU [Actinobacillus pleuropneumoniae]
MKERVLLPSYMKTFSCVGSACEDSCCVGWTVELDKRIYKKYKNIKHAELTSKLNKGMKRIKDASASNSKYAYFVMDQQKRCPMLNEENLCSIQLNLGEEMLSPVCTTYPKILNRKGTEFELSAKLSCPEVTRLALLNPTGIEFEQSEYDLNPSWAINSVNGAQSIGGSDISWNLREFSIDIIQCRNLSVSDRMIFLGLFMNRLQVLVDKKQYESIQLLIDEYRSKLGNKNYISSLENIADNLPMQIKTLLELIMLRRKLGISNQRYLDCFESMLKGLDLDRSQEIEIRDIEEKYLFNYQEYFVPFFGDHEYIFENYLVNYIFESMFPKMDTNQIFEQYIKMSVIYAMLKMHFVGISGQDKGITIDLAIKLIQSFTRVIDHYPSYLKGLVEIITNHGFDTVAHIAALLKDRNVTSERIHK